MGTVGAVTDRWARPSALEVARGGLIGGGYVDPLLAGGLAVPYSARGALEAAILPALQRSPCVVTFSGGRDSSAVLAVAVGLARRLGLSEPVAVTRHWPAVAETDESAWQEQVVRHVGVANWERVAFEETDLVGPTCAPSLLARGPMWPPLIHTWPPIFELAKGGAILTGEGGDELFDPYRGTIVRWLLSHPRGIRNPEALRLVVQAMAPRMARELRVRSEPGDLVPAWLPPHEARNYRHDQVRWKAEEPLGWLPAVARAIGDRSHRVGHHNLAVLASDYGAELLSPLLDPAFVLGCAHQAGRWGFPGRTAAMRALFGSDLPDTVLSRRDKVYTNSVILASATRAFADQWSGRGLDTTLIDTDVIRACWRQEDVPLSSALALQTAWYADHTDGP
jgi:hypothetical protein